MKEKLIKFTVILILFVLALSMIYSVQASSMSSTIKSNFNGSTSGEGRTAVTQIISSVLGVVRTIGAAVAVIILMTIAGKYIIASAGDRADIKKYAMNYVIGALILFGATGILSIVKNFVDSSLG